MADFTSKLLGWWEAGPSAGSSSQTIHKLVLMAHSRKAYGELGRFVASAKRLAQGGTSTIGGDNRLRLQGGRAVRDDILSEQDFFVIQITKPCDCRRGFATKVV